MRTCDVCRRPVYDGRRFEAKSILPNGRESVETNDLCDSCWDRKYRSDLSQDARAVLVDLLGEEVEG